MKNEDQEVGNENIVLKLVDKQQQVNGATIICKENDTLKIEPSENDNINCIIETNAKLGKYFDRLPYGIINKNITGIGATTLEMNSPRNSIIVFPTKALAYSKYTSKIAKHGKESGFYIGSPIGTIKSDITHDNILEYINLNNGKCKKFFVVADSLPRVLRAIEEPNYKDYFLMIDEIDSLQSDGTYRPALENVIDYYCIFPRTHRACVSATIRAFSNPVLRNESMITINYEDVIKRKINLISTDNEDMVVVNLIKKILVKGNIMPCNDDKILIAYNSLDGINQCIKLLKNELEKDKTSTSEVDNMIGILCSERSFEKAGKYKCHINEDGTLDRQIIFMTCAYFTGIDIENRCHLISVSTSNQPFTLISEEKLTQISGRCRKGLLSETIVYTTFNRTIKKDEEDTDNEVEEVEEYEEIMEYGKLVEQATDFSDAANAFHKVLSHKPELHSLSNIFKQLTDMCTVQIKNYYPVKLTRKDIHGKIVPSFLNIDAIIERYDLAFSLYKDKKTLPERLLSKHDIKSTEDNPLRSEFQKSALKKIKSEDKEKTIMQLNEIAEILLQTPKIALIPKINDSIKHGNKQISAFHTRLYKLLPYADLSYLTENLIIDHYSKAKLKSFNNSLIFNALDDNNDIKILFKGKFGYDSIIGKKGRDSGITVERDDVIKKVKEILKTTFPTAQIRDYDAYAMFKDFFLLAPGHATIRIKGLNPQSHPKAKEVITNESLYDLLEL